MRRLNVNLDSALLCVVNGGVYHALKAGLYSEADASECEHLVGIIRRMATDDSRKKVSPEWGADWRATQDRLGQLTETEAVRLIHEANERFRLSCEREEVELARKGELFAEDLFCEDEIEDMVNDHHALGMAL